MDVSGLCSDLRTLTGLRETCFEEYAFFAVMTPVFLKRAAAIWDMATGRARKKAKKTIVLVGEVSEQKQKSPTTLHYRYQHFPNVVLTYH